MESPNQQHQLTAAIYRLQQRWPLMGTFLVNVPHQIVNAGSSIRTAAVVCHGHGRQPRLSLLINSRFWASLPGPQDQEFLCLHECLHILCRHIDSARTHHYRHSGLYNLAADLVVNFLAGQQINSPYLLQQGVTCQQLGWPTNLPLGLYYQKLSQLQTGRPGSDRGRQQILAAALADRHPTQSSHAHWSAGLDQPLQQQLQQYWQQSCRQLAAAGQEIGDLPAGIERQWAGLNPPAVDQSMDWSQLLDQLKAQLQSRQLAWSAQRPSKRFGPALPGLRWRPQLQRLYAALDLSGSISDPELEQFWQLLQQLSAQMPALAMTVICFDQRVLKVSNLRQLDPARIRCLGGGGSDISPVLSAIQQGQIEEGQPAQPDSLIVFSDGRVRLQQPVADSYRGSIIWIISPPGIKPQDELWQKLPGQKIRLSG